MFPMRDNVDIGNAVAMMSFATVVNCGSFSGAARMLNCSKAAVSRQVARLEERIGIQLLVRTTRQVSVTPAGQEFYTRCARIVDEVTETNQLMAGMLTTPRGELKVNAPVVSTLFRIPEVIPGFVKRYRDVRVNLSLSDSKVDLLAGGFDVAFWMGEPYDPALDAVRLRSFEMVACCSPEYRRARGQPATPADLRDHDCIVETHLSKPGEWRLADKLEVQIGKQWRLMSNSARMSRQAMLAGLGIAFLPRFVVEEDLEAGRLVPVLAQYVTAKLEFYVIFPKSHYLLAKVKAFVDYVTEEFADEPTAPPRIEAPRKTPLTKTKSRTKRRRGARA
ncbi:MAG: LysR family transcriptional regulator [Proteobacteria bacterium]|nr:LysR family transcriptional regulator [Pseudomonadota bacterium]